MALEQKDLEAIERIVCNHGDSVAVSIASSFERMEQRTDAAESRLYSRLAELENKIYESAEDLGNAIARVRGDTRELLADEV